MLASLARRIAKRYLGENLKPKKRGEREREREGEGEEKERAWRGHRVRRTRHAGKNFPEEEGAEEGGGECYDRNSNTSCAHSPHPHFTAARRSSIHSSLSPYLGRQILLTRTDPLVKEGKPSLPSILIS